MKRNAVSLKAIINNIAKENNVSAQSILQTYMLERLFLGTPVFRDTYQKHLDKTKKESIINKADN